MDLNVYIREATAIALGQAAVMNGTADEWYTKKHYQRGEMRGYTLHIRYKRDTYFTPQREAMALAA